MALQSATPARQRRFTSTIEKVARAVTIVAPCVSSAAFKRGFRVEDRRGRDAMVSDSPEFIPTPAHIATLDRLVDEIAELSAHLEAATARLLDLIREFDARGGWSNGFRSCADWLSWRVGLDRGAARERVRVARALGTLPRLARAFACGEISYSKVRAITRVATPETEERLLGVARAGTAIHVERIVRGWRRIDRKAEAEEATRRHTTRALHVFHDDDGMVVIPRTPRARGRSRLASRPRRRPRDALPAATRGHTRNRAAARSADGRAAAGGRARPHRRDALHQGMDPGTPGERYQVVVHVDAAVLANREEPGQSVLEDGARVSAETSQRLACDASRVVMRHHDGGRVVEIGARTRTIPPALRRALQHRDEGGRFPGCGSRLAEGHHVRHWAAGGPTTLSNLALLCRRHHRAVHEDGYQVIRQTDGDLEFRRPDGRVLPEVSPAPLLLDDPLETLCAANIEYGFSIDAQTGRPEWTGERLDVGWALDVLHPLANPSPPRRDDDAAECCNASCCQEREAEGASGRADDVPRPGAAVT